MTNESMRKFLEVMQGDMEKIRKRAVRRLIPAVIFVSLALVGIGIIIGKYLL